MRVLWYYIIYKWFGIVLIKHKENPFLFLPKSTSIYLPNFLGKGERLSAEYTCGTRNHIDYRLNFTSPISLNPNKQ